MPAYPIVILGAWKIGRPFTVSILETSETAQGWQSVVLSFCIVPTGKQRSATPVLRVDLCGVVLGGPYSFASILGWPSPGKARLKALHGEYVIDIPSVPNLSTPFTAFDRERRASKNPWGRPDILFLPIEASVCRNWFRFQPGESLYGPCEMSIPNSFLGADLWEAFGLDARFSPFGAATLAGLVDAALWTGTLDGFLEEQAKRLTEAFDEARKAAEDERDRRWKKVKERLENYKNP